MKKIIPVILIALITLASGFLISKLRPAQNLDNIIADANTRYFAPETKVSDDIVIVFLDEATMKELPYRSPVPRDFLFKLNESILAAKPKAVGYDIFFKDPTIASVDEKLAASLKKGPVFAVSAGKLDDAGKDFEDPPMDLFLNSLKGTGLADLPFSSSDSTVRFARFDFDYSGKIHNSFVARLYHAATGGSASANLHDPAKRLSKYGLRYDPYFVADAKGAEETRIRYVGPPSKIEEENNLFKIFPASLVAGGLIPSDWLKDKVVLVGAAYEDGTDAYITPYYSSRYNYKRMPGVEIHANVLNQLLTKQFYYETPKHALILGLVFLGLVGGFLFLYGPMWRGIAGVILFTLILIAKVVLAFNFYGVVVPLIPFEGALLIAFGVSLGYRSVTEGKQKRFIKSVFAKYVPPSVVDKMIANPKLLTLGGELREITSLFTDIASFTTISEKLDPKTVVSFLNEYLDALTRVIFKHGGTLDKYEGDAIIAFFGAPVELPNHREAAVLAALEMQKESARISDKWKEICGREIITRVGINSGQVVVGNMGSDLRFDYTAIGDTMNLASRLEGANKFFDTIILAGETTVQPLLNDNKILFRPIAKIKVKGKNKAIATYSPIGISTELTSEEVSKIRSLKMPEEVVELTSK